MSQKLWNKAKGASKQPVETDLRAEYRTIIGELTAEAVERKNEIIFTCLEKKWDDVWDLIDDEARAVNGREGGIQRQTYIADLAKQHDRELTRSGPSVWIVAFETVEEIEETEAACQILN